MRAGGLRYKLEVLRPVKTVGNFGEDVVTWETVKTIRAERDTFSGKRSIEIGETFPDYTVKFNIRDAHVVEANWRVRQLGGYLYNVVSVEPHIFSGYKVLSCERVNE